MAIGKASDFKIYEEEFYGGMYERVAQFIDAFNGASRGAIRLVQADLVGQYQKESFLKDLASLISRRDLTSVAAATDQAMTQDQFVSVKINRKIGPVAQTLDAWRKIGKDQREMSFKLGGMIADKKLQDYINTALIAVEAALEGQANLTVDKSAASPATLTHSWLVSAMALMGDRASRITAFVMHSKPYFDLMGQTIADKLLEVTGATIFNGTIATFNRPVIVIDAPALLQAGSPNKYPVLGLVDGAVTVTESEQQEIVSEMVTGLEQLAFRVQGEYAFNVGVKGFQWDITNGGANPADAAVGTTTNWDKAATADKDLAGVRLLVQ